MDEIIPAVVAGAGSLLAALLGYRPFTREGRLTARAQRLGEVYSLLPDSPERAELKFHLLRAVSEVSDWVDPSKSARRWIVRVLLGILFVLSVWGLWALASAFELGIIAMALLGFPAGAIVGVLGLGIGALLQRFVDARATERDRATRLERLARGQHPAQDL